MQQIVGWGAWEVKDVSFKNWAYFFVQIFLINEKGLVS
jgi:hypothetical protein